MSVAESKRCMQLSRSLWSLYFLTAASSNFFWSSSNSATSRGKSLFVNVSPVFVWVSETWNNFFKNNLNIFYVPVYRSPNNSTNKETTKYHKLSSDQYFGAQLFYNNSKLCMNFLIYLYYHCRHIIPLFHNGTQEYHQLWDVTSRWIKEFILKKIW